MRLIDADALIEFIDPEHLRHPGELTFSELDVVNMLNHAPTAYDADKVVSNLEHPELGLEDDNLVSLCTQCHNLRHGRAPKRFVRKKKLVSAERW